MTKKQKKKAIKYYQQLRVKMEELKIKAIELEVFMGVMHCDWWIDRCNKRIEELSL